MDGSERSRGALNVRASCPQFREFLFFNGLRDLGALGVKFT